jgi:hypothetical protein
VERRQCLNAGTGSLETFLKTKGSKYITQGLIMMTLLLPMRIETRREYLVETETSSDTPIRMISKYISTITSRMERYS